MGRPLRSPVAKLSCEAATEENAKRRSFMPRTQVTGKANFSPGITSGLPVTQEEWLRIRKDRSRLEVRFTNLSLYLGQRSCLASTQNSAAWLSFRQPGIMGHMPTGPHLIFDKSALQCLSLDGTN